jgi:hypothetical protein
MIICRFHLFAPSQLLVRANYLDRALVPMQVLVLVLVPVLIVVVLVLVQGYHF